MSNSIEGIGLERFDHVGIAVPDLAVATDFFVDVLGFEKAYVIGPIEAGREWLSENLGSGCAARVTIQVLNMPGGKVELFEFSPKPEGDHPRRDELGSASLGLKVRDLDRSVERLRAAGAEILGGRKDVDDGPIAGTSWVYAKAPWGLLLFVMASRAG